MAETKIELQDAMSAYKSFFKKDEKGNVVTAKASAAKKEEAVAVDEDTPLTKLLNKAKDTNPKKVTKPDGSKVSAQTPFMPADVARTLEEKEVTFEELLTEYKLKYSDLFEAIDSYLENGYFEKMYDIKGFKFAFRTRKVYSMDKIAHAMEESNYVTEGGKTQLSLKHRLASILVFFKLRKEEAVIFNHDKIEDDDTVLKFLSDKISAPIFGLMVKEMMKFDVLVGLSVRDEAIDRFLSHSTDSEEPSN